MSWILVAFVVFPAVAFAVGWALPYARWRNGRMISPREVNRSFGAVLAAPAAVVIFWIMAEQSAFQFIRFFEDRLMEGESPAWAFFVACGAMGFLAVIAGVAVYEAFCFGSRVKTNALFREYRRRLDWRVTPEELEDIRYVIE